MDVKNIFKANQHENNVFEIDYEKLKQKNIKYLIFDLDNTLITFQEDKPSEKLVNFIEQLKRMEFKMCILSNASFGKRRAQRIAEILGLPIITTSLKPFKGSFTKVKRMFNITNSNEVAVIGDQLLTDILGGNLSSFYTIKVKPLSNKEPFFTKINRVLEHLINKWVK